MAAMPHWATQLRGDRDQSVISVSICSAYQLHSFLFGAENNFPVSTPHGKPLLMGVD